MRFLILFISLTSIAHAQSPFKWPGGKKSAIVLTYDDALLSQLNIAIPQLDSVKLKGTFFLTGNFSQKEIPRWQKAAAAGHELANHTLYHPCRSSAIPADPHFASENYNINLILREISVMNNFLYAIDGKSSRTFAYPCTETSVGGKDYTDSLASSGLVKYARIGGDQNTIITDFKSLKPMLIPSWGFSDNPSGTRLVDYVKRVQQADGLGIFMFHGVGGDYLQVTADAHRQLVQYLHEHANEIWVATFQEVMDYITKGQK